MDLSEEDEKTTGGPAKPEPAATGHRPPRVGIVLGAGAARGWCHVGVLRELLSSGLDIHAICGCSSGALVAASCAAGRLAVLENLAEQMTTVRMLRFFDVSWTRGGLIEGRWLLNFFREKLGPTMIEDLPVRYGAVATEYRSGREVWLRRGSLIDAARASIALPGLLTPIALNGRTLLDGALVNPLPVTLCRSLGADIVIAVDLSVDRVVPPIHSPPEATSPRSGGWWARFSGKPHGEEVAAAAPPAPKYQEVIADAVFTMQSFITRVRLATDPADLVLRPEIADLGVMEFQRAREFIERGVTAVRERRADIDALLPHAALSDVPDQSVCRDAQIAAKMPLPPSSA